MTEMTELEAALLDTEDEKLLLTLMHIAGVMEFIFAALATISGLLFLIAIVLLLSVFGVL